MSTDIYFGIDFGTTYSSIAFYDTETGRAEPILNDHGELKTPSVVYFGKDDILVGKDATDKFEEYGSSTDPGEREDANQRIVRSIKRNLINPPLIPIPGRDDVRPVEVVALILGRLKQDAEEGHFYEEIERAVITCPAIFGKQDRDVLREAAEVAGFREVALFEEPTAAAIAFGRRGQKVGKGVLVYDLGAGTFDLAVVVRDEEDGTFEAAMEAQGDERCGGDDLDQTLYEHCDGIAKEKLGRPISLTGEIDKFFLRHCRLRKESLSKNKTTKFSSYLPSENGSQQFVYEMDRETFEGLIHPRIKDTVSKTARLFEQAGQQKHEVDTVVLIGGSSQIPLVERMLKETLPVPLRKFAERDYAVALGAAYHAYELWNPTPPTPPPSPSREKYRKELKVCWQDGQLTRTEAERLENLAKNELGLSPEEAAVVEREVMGDTVEKILENQMRSDPTAMLKAASESAKRGDGYETISLLRSLLEVHPEFDIRRARRDEWISRCKDSALREFLTPTFSHTHDFGLFSSSFTVVNTSAFRTTSVEVAASVELTDGERIAVPTKLAVEALGAGESFRWTGNLLKPDIEVINQGRSGFLGIGREDADIEVELAGWSDDFSGATVEKAQDKAATSLARKISGVSATVKCAEDNPTFSVSYYTGGSVFGSSVELTNTSAIRTTDIEVTVNVTRKDGRRIAPIKLKLGALGAGENHSWEGIFHDPGLFGRNIASVSIDVKCAEGVPEVERR